MEPWFVLDELAGGATVLSASQAALAGTAAGNIIKHEPGLVYRCAASGPSSFVDFIIDAGRPITWDTLAVLGTNQRAGDRVALYAHPSDPAVPVEVGNLVIAGVDNVKSPAYPTPMKIVKWIASARTDRYFRVRLIVGGTALPEGFHQCGTVLIGRRWSFGYDMDTNAAAFLVDPSPVVEGPGFADYQPMAPRTGWRVTFSWVPSNKWWDFVSLFRTVGQSGMVLFVPEPGQQARFHETVVFGRLQQISARHPIYDGWQTEITIVSVQP